MKTKLRHPNQYVSVKSRNAKHFLFAFEPFGSLLSLASGWSITQCSLHLPTKKTNYVGEDGVKIWGHSVSFLHIFLIEQFSVILYKRNLVTELNLTLLFCSFRWHSCEANTSKYMLVFSGECTKKKKKDTNGTGANFQLTFNARCSEHIQQSRQKEKKEHN